MPLRAVIGHRRLVSLLSRAVARATLPPSLLLAGPPAVGKRTLAISVAQAINCLQPLSGESDSVLATAGLERDACGTCACCRRIERRTHPDVLVVEPGDMGSIRIEQVRDVIERASYRPFEARRRVVVVDEADTLVPPAQNAFLKTLEEPPAGTIFVLVSSIPDALLATVRSRCTRVRFGALSAAEVAEILMRDHSYPEEEARAAAADADGSIGRALSARSLDLMETRAAARSLLEQAARTSDPAQRIELVKELTTPAARPVASRRQASTSSDEARGPGGQLKIAGERDRLEACLRALASLLRDLGILSVRGDPRMVANADLAAEFERLSGAFDSDRTDRAFIAVDQALVALDRNVSPKVVADWVVLRL